MPYLRLARGVGAVTAVGHSHQANPGQSQGDGETQCLKVHSGEAPDGPSLRSQAVIARCGFTTRLNRNGYPASQLVVMLRRWLARSGPVAAHSADA